MIDYLDEGTTINSRYYASELSKMKKSKQACLHCSGCCTCSIWLLPKQKSHQHGHQFWKHWWGHMCCGECFKGAGCHLPWLDCYAWALLDQVHRCQQGRYWKTVRTVMFPSLLLDESQNFLNDTFHFWRRFTAPGWSSDGAAWRNTETFSSNYKSSCLTSSSWQKIS